MAKIVASGSDDKIVTGDGGDQVEGRAGNDQILGGAGSDLIMAGTGNDTVTGGAGDDVIYGSSTTPVGFSEFKVAETQTAKVVFNGESAGYQNALGVYTYDSEGNVTGVKILFANASLKGSGGDLKAGVSSSEFEVAKGDRLGFFVVPNGFAISKANAALLSGEKFVMKGLDGEPANVLTSKGLNLFAVDAKTGAETKVVSQYKDQIFHSMERLNQDKLDHVKTTLDPATGQIKIGFEDLLGGGDKDFDDSVFTVTLGSETVKELVAAKTAKPSDDDNLSGGAGNDMIYGKAGNDTISGGEGDDKLWGNSGADQISGDEGNDVLSGGKDDDVVSGGEGNDQIRGDSGNDVLSDGAGNDVASGGTGDDRFIAAEGGNDRFDGGKGRDTIDYSGSGLAISVDLSKHSVVSGASSDYIKGIEVLVATNLDDTFLGSKNADTIFGMGGNDVFRGKGGADVFTGGEGDDTFVYLRKDLGGIDRITDFVVGEDMLNLRNLVKGQDLSDLSAVIHLSGSTDGTMVSVNQGGIFKDVVLLESLDGTSLTGLQEAGALIL